jgi:hypothetical protein
MQRQSAKIVAEPDLFADHQAMLAEGRNTARALAEVIGQDGERLALAGGFCAQVAAAYWKALGGVPALRSLPIGVDTAGLAGPAQGLASGLGTAAARLAPERAFHELGRIYNRMIPEAFRLRYGVYYTPPGLTERLLDQASAAGVDWPTCRVLDAACGAGPFWPRWRIGLDPVQRERVRRRLYGHANLYGVFTDFALRQTRAGASSPS